MKKTLNKISIYLVTISIIVLGFSIVIGLRALWTFDGNIFALFIRLFVTSIITIFLCYVLYAATEK